MDVNSQTLRLRRVKNLAIDRKKSTPTFSFVLPYIFIRLGVDYFDNLWLICGHSCLK